MSDADFNASIDRRLSQLATGQAQLLIQLTELATQQRAMNGDLTAVMAEIGGAPDWRVRGSRDTVRARLHHLENDRAAANFATEALQAAQAAREAAESRNSQSRDRHWSVRQKTGLFVIAGATAVEGILRLFGVGG